MKKNSISMEGYQPILNIRFDNLPKPGYSAQKDPKKQLNAQPNKQQHTNYSSHTTCASL